MKIKNKIIEFVKKETVQSRGIPVLSPSLSEAQRATAFIQLNKESRQSVNGSSPFCNQGFLTFLQSKVPDPVVAEFLQMTCVIQNVVRHISFRFPDTAFRYGCRIGRMPLQKQGYSFLFCPVKCVSECLHIILMQNPPSFTFKIL